MTSQIPCIGFLHNRKTGGTALKQILEAQNTAIPFEFFGHLMSFPRFIKEYPQLSAIFFIREPISRFVSGFYSRLRQGKPRYDFPWTKAEAKAFARFDTPNKLAEALSATNPITRFFAMRAMKSIKHVKHTYVDFLGTISFLNANIHRIAFIGHQPEFDSDLTHIQHLLGIKNPIPITLNDETAHRNPSTVDKFLSETAMNNLMRWYKKDIEIYHWCLGERKKRFTHMTAGDGRKERL